jgi:acyl-CoA reductase-like NAD-dependent aldehyde dehydrogenase
MLTKTKTCLSFPFLSLGHEPDADLGPVISPESKKRICDLIQSGVTEGATILLDGRNITVPKYEKGNFVGPTVLADVKVCSAHLSTGHLYEYLLINLQGDMKNIIWFNLYDTYSQT